MRVLNVEYRELTRLDSEFYEYHDMMKFRIEIEVDGRRFVHQKYVYKEIPYRDLVEMAKRELGALIVNELLGGI